MILNDVEIVDTFAEAFPMAAARVIVTAATAEWAMTAATTATGYASSVIGCDAEAGIEEVIEAGPDGRPGVAMLFYRVALDGPAETRGDALVEGWLAAAPLEWRFDAAIARAPTGPVLKNPSDIGCQYTPASMVLYTPPPLLP